MWCKHSCADCWLHHPQLGWGAAALCRANKLFFLTELPLICAGFVQSCSAFNWLLPPSRPLSPSCKQVNSARNALLCRRRTTILVSRHDRACAMDSHCYMCWTRHMSICVQSVWKVHSVASCRLRMVVCGHLEWWLMVCGTSRCCSHSSRMFRHSTILLFHLLLCVVCAYIRGLCLSL